MPFSVCKYLSTLVVLFTFSLGNAHAVLINEVRIDQPGTDTDEYFELLGNANESLDGLSYLVIGDGTGGSGVIESVTSLSGLTLSGDGLFLAAENSFSLGSAVDLFTSLNFENSDNVTHLLVNAFSGTKGDDLDADDDGVLDVLPWLEIVDSMALIDSAGSGDQVYSPNQIGPNEGKVPAHVFRAANSGTWQIGSTTIGDDTPGAVNMAVPEPSALWLFLLGLVGLSLVRVRQHGARPWQPAFCKGLAW
jgi:hypothetical protein